MTAGRMRTAYLPVLDLPCEGGGAERGCAGMPLEASQRDHHPYTRESCGSWRNVLVNRPDRRIKGLGEVSIRVNDLAVMCAFYEDVVGLKVLRREESYVFFEIAEGYGGHAQNLALFDASECTFLESKSRTLSADQSVDAASHRLEHRSRGL